MQAGVLVAMDALRLFIARRFSHLVAVSSEQAETSPGLASLPGTFLANAPVLQKYRQVFLQSIRGAFFLFPTQYMQSSFESFVPKREW